MKVIDNRKKVLLEEVVAEATIKSDSDILARRDSELSELAQRIYAAQKAECPIEAVGNHVVIIKDPPEVNIGSLSYSESTLKEQQKATVMSVGEEVNYKLPVGTKVWIDKYVTTNREIIIDGIGYSIIDKCEIACSFKK
jgi:co-chaperonin GroES (HSP10)